jgi:hypothetical protein
MGEESHRVSCANCQTSLDEPSDVPAEQREPCPVCGSTGRVFELSGAIVVTSRMAAEAIRVDTSPADETVEAQTIRHQYRATLEWFQLEGGLWMLHVVSENGELIEGGIGDNPEDAVLEVYERLIPPKG